MRKEFDFYFIVLSDRKLFPLLNATYRIRIAFSVAKLYFVKRLSFKVGCTEKNVIIV